MRHAGRERLVAGQAAPPQARAGIGQPRAGEPAAGGRLMPFTEPEPGERLAAFGGERRDPGGVARIADGRDRRVHLVQGQRRGGHSRFRPAQPQVSEEAVALERKYPAAAAAAPGEVKHRAAVAAAHPARQATVVLAEERR